MQAGPNALKQIISQSETQSTGLWRRWPTTKMAARWHCVPLIKHLSEQYNSKFWVSSSFWYLPGSSQTPRNVSELGLNIPVFISKKYSSDFEYIAGLVIHMGDFTRGGEWLLKNVTFFFYGETNISLKINIDTKQPTCMYKLRFSRGPHNFCLGLSLVELV